MVPPVNVMLPALLCCVSVTPPAESMLDTLPAIPPLAARIVISPEPAELDRFPLRVMPFVEVLSPTDMAFLLVIAPTVTVELVESMVTLITDNCFEPRGQLILSY